MKTFLLILWWQGLVLATFAVVPPDYYSPIEGKQAAELKTALSCLLQGHRVLDYDSLWTVFVCTDSRPDGTIWDMYSNRQQTSFQGMNREHAFPKSWWGGSINAAYSDLHHLYPADWEANRAKSNFPLGVVGVPVFNNGVSKVGYARYQEAASENLVFEPADAYKGDFARAYFYVVTCYQDLIWRHTFMVETNTYPTLKPEAIRLLVEWHRNDPVSPKERQRNEVVFDYQHNRNPFVDYPELVSYLWGDSTSYAFSLLGREGAQPGNLLQVYTRQGLLYVHSTTPGLKVELYNPMGISLQNATTTGTQQCLGSFPSGVYVVRCSGSVWKVFVQ
jgi:endonuclease I